MPLYGYYSAEQEMLFARTGQYAGLDNYPKVVIYETVSGGEVECTMVDSCPDYVGEFDDLVFVGEVTKYVRSREPML